jgi:hypothetical protein
VASILQRDSSQLLQKLLPMFLNAFTSAKALLCLPKTGVGSLIWRCIATMFAFSKKAFLLAAISNADERIATQR